MEEAEAAPAPSLPDAEEPWDDGPLEEVVEGDPGESAEAVGPEDAEELPVPDWSPPRRPKAPEPQHPSADTPEPPEGEPGEAESDETESDQTEPPSDEPSPSPEDGPLLETQPGKVANLLAFLGQLTQFLPEEKRRKMHEDDLPLRMEKLRHTLSGGAEPPTPPQAEERSSREVLQQMVQQVRRRLDQT